jgi:ComF family protein
MDSDLSTVYVCAECQDVASSIDGIRAYAFHREQLREAIHQFKYEGLTALAPPLGALMTEGWESLAPEGVQIEVIVPVPLHPTRLRKRGYNQAALLAQELGRALERPVIEDVLARTKATVPQVGLSSRDRQANVEGAFTCADNRLAGNLVLLIDDVYTTGSTLEAAALALREGGAASVWAYTLARAG